jgi:LacI family transcriptional regulator
MNIKTLAGQLGISVSTVSKALNDSHEISAETKKKVLELATQLNYTPNAYAGSLRNKKSNNIAVVLPEVADSFFSQAINGIESVAQEKGYHVIVYLTHEKVHKEQSILGDFRSGRVDGVLMSVSGETTSHDHIRRLCEKNIRLVFFDRVIEDVAAARVITNDFESAYKATAQLLSKCCKRLAFLSMSDKLAIINYRLEGFKKALADAAVLFDPAMLVNCSSDEQQTQYALKELLTRTDRPDAVLASAEKPATDIYNVCNQIGLRIPADLKVIAFSSMQIAALLHPPLSTITQPAFEMGKLAAALLFKALEKTSFKLEKECIVVPSVFVERGSSASAFPG